MKRMFPFLAFMVAASLFPVSTARADTVGDAVATAMKELAQSIKPVLVKAKAQRVRVGGFQSPGRAAGGPEIQVKLAEALEKLEFKIDKIDFDVDVRGRYEEHNGQRGLLAVRVVAQLFAANGKPLSEVSAQVDKDEANIEHAFYGTEAVPRLLGISSSVPHNIGEPERSRRLREQQKRSPADIQGARVFGKPGSPHAVEVLVKQGGKYRPRKPTGRGRSNLPFVPISNSEIYAVRLINNSPHEAAVNLTIDGISVFQLSTTKPKPKFWIVPARGDTLVLGWDKSDQKTIEFKVVDFPDTIAAKLNIKPNETIGQICAHFSACWENDGQRPSDEPKSRGTGGGAEIKDPKKLVKRKIGNVRETIILRYER